MRLCRGHASRQQWNAYSEQRDRKLLSLSSPRDESQTKVISTRLTFHQDMDWDEDFNRVTDEDFRKVWKYDAKRTSVVRLLDDDQVRQYAHILII